MKFSRGRFRITTASIVVVLAANLAAAQISAPQTTPLDTLVRAEIAPFKGKVFLFAKNLDTGVSYSFNGDERVRTASTIKVAVMIEAFTRVAEGRAKWTDELVLTKAARYGGSGVLPELADGLRLTLRDCVNLMMVVSDNTATNMVLDYLTTDAVNARMNALGFKDTRIMRRIGGGGESREGKEPDNKRFGLGATTPHEMVRILEKIDAGEIVNKAAAKEMIDLMKREQARYAIGRTIWDVPMASKYGALDNLRSCVAIVYSKRGRIAIAITVDDMPEVNWSVDNPGYLLMSRLSLILIEELARKSLQTDANQALFF
jgi:beta-lactamase class A